MEEIFGFVVGVVVVGRGNGDGSSLGTTLSSPLSLLLLLLEPLLELLFLGEPIDIDSPTDKPTDTAPAVTNNFVAVLAADALGIGRAVGSTTTVFTSALLVVLLLLLHIPACADGGDNLPPVKPNNRREKIAIALKRD